MLFCSYLIILYLNEVVYNVACSLDDSLQASVLSVKNSRLKESNLNIYYELNTNEPISLRHCIQVT